MGDGGQGAGGDHPVQARQHAADLTLMTFNEGVDRQTSTAWGLPTTIDPRTCLVPALPGQGYNAGCSLRAPDLPLGLGLFNDRSTRLGYANGHAPDRPVATEAAND